MRAVWRAGAKEPVLGVADRSSGSREAEGPAVYMSGHSAGEKNK